MELKNFSRVFCLSKNFNPFPKWDNIKLSNFGNSSFLKMILNLCRGSNLTYLKSLFTITNFSEKS